MKRPHQNCTPEEYNRRWMARVKANSIVSNSGCWLWQGTTRGIGHGTTMYRNKGCTVHRMFYMLHIGRKLGRWEYVCHRCDVPNCFNPDHLWIGSPAENQKDMQAKLRGKYQKATHCKQGHEFTSENTWVHKRTNHRHCRTCARIHNRLKAGWTLEQAQSIPKTPYGQRPIGGSTDRSRKTEPVVRSSITPEEIRVLLAAAGLSQVRGAKRVGVSERSMRRYIRGEIPMIEPAAKALRALAG